jgi:ribosome-binding factor A
MKHEVRGGKRHHKDLQLCRQVFDALTYALAELDDPLVDELVLASVMPAPSSARVLVTLVPTRDDIDADVALDHVREHAEELREEVEAEVTRKRAPELVFRIGRPDEQQ